MIEPRAEHPSGAQHEIIHGDQRAVVVEVGGGLRAYGEAQGPLLDGYELEEVCTGGRGQQLLPWPNRVRDGGYEFDGTKQQLALTEPAAHNAIHGLVRWANWNVLDRAEPRDRVVVEYMLHPEPGWPGTLHLQIAYALDHGGLTVTTSTTNVGAVAVPFGSGAHPYLTLGTESIDSLILQAPGRRYLKADGRGIPIGAGEVRGTEYDFTEPRRIGDSRLDTAFADLARDDDGRTRVRLQTADGTRRAALWMDDAYPYLMLFTGDSLAGPKRRRGLGIEPMTCAPNAFQSGDGLVRLDPGATHVGAWGISPG